MSRPLLVRVDELGDPVLLLEAQDELAAGVGGLVQLLEPERERRRLRPFDEEELRLDVVRLAELVPLPESELPGLSRRDPVLDDLGELSEPLLDLDLELHLGPLGRGRPRLDVQVDHAHSFPAPRRGKPASEAGDGEAIPRC